MDKNNTKINMNEPKYVKINKVTRNSMQMNELFEILSGMKMKHPLYLIKTYIYSIKMEKLDCKKSSITLLNEVILKKKVITNLKSREFPSIKF